MEDAMRVVPSIIFGVAASLGVAIAGVAQATTVSIDGGPTGWGCTSCFGGPPALVGVGHTVTLDNEGKPGPLQLTLGAGTYAVTNASQSLSNYSAFRFDGGGSDWAWNYVIASDNGNNTANVVKVGYLAGVLPSQSAWQSATGLQSFYWDNGAHLVDGNVATTGYRDTFTLGSTTTLDFFVIDGFLSDNAGGIALNIAPVAATPIPATLPLFASALGVLGFAARRRRRDAKSAG
jgi:hypothetical protein